jgi:XTP/dITP diphosphohydrolase
MKRIVLATNNSGKIREIRGLLVPLDLDLVPQSELAIPEADEPHLTFVENALAKARHAAAISKLPALAEDSGLCIDALGGAPGVHSARFAGEPRSDSRNNARVLESLVQTDERGAHYHCAVVLLRRPDDPAPLISEGDWHGEILRAPRGTGGFGYDSLFFDPRLGKTGAELSLAEKNRVSHRAKAFATLAQKLRLGPDRAVVIV